MKKFAVFDIDGTLVRWQLYHALTDRLANQGLLGKNAREQLHTARMHWKIRQNPDSFREYEQILIEVFESAVSQLSTQALELAAKEVSQTYNDQVYTFSRKLIKDLKKQGYFLLAISGSHQELVENIARQYGFNDWRGTVYERQCNSFSGQKFVASHHKKAVLEELIAQHKLSMQGSVAVGDSASDAPMLTMVEQPIAFNPDRQLYNLARQNDWKIVIERKNMIYELEPKDGRYILS